MIAVVVGISKVPRHNSDSQKSYPQFKGTRQSYSKSNDTGLASELPQSKMNNVNVNIKQYHAKAVVHQNNYQITQQSSSTTYSAQTLAVSSSAKMQSYGGGATNYTFNSTSANYGISSYQPTDFYNSVNTFRSYQTNQPVSQYSTQYNIPHISIDANQNTYRALGDPVALTISYEDEFAATPSGSLGLTDNGDGTFSYNMFWPANFLSYVQYTVGISPGSPLFAEIEANVSNWKYYPQGSTPSVPGLPDDPALPLGNGILGLILMAFCYVLKKANIFKEKK